MLYTDMAKEVETKLGLISQRAKREPKATFNNLTHLINEAHLRRCYFQLGRNRATGVDGITWQEYGKDLKANIKSVVERMRQMKYIPQPARRVYIPKDDHTERPLSIPATEDKIVQKAMSRIMEAIYENDFHDWSYGFRPNKSCHMALRELNNRIKFERVNHVIEADIKGFFDNVSHKRLIELIRIRIQDEKFLRYIVRFLKAGYMDSELVKATDRGTPQGANISPMLANVFLHYVLDKWLKEQLRPQLKGECYLVRYCDDFVILTQYQEEAEHIMRRLKERFREFELELHPDKSRIASFGRCERDKANRQHRKPNTFEFLGFTHYCSISRQGRFKIARKTAAKRLRNSLKDMNQWLKASRNNYKLKQLWQMLSVRLQGHYQYYGVSDNSESIRAYYEKTRRMVFKWLNRRSHRKSFSWEQFAEYLKHYPLPKPRIVYRIYVPSHAGRVLLKSRMKENFTYGSVRGVDAVAYGRMM